MNNTIRLAVFSFLLILAESSMAEHYTLPVRLDYTLIKKVLSSQVYTGAGNSAELWHDKHHCSSLTLSDLKVSSQDKQIKLINNVQAQLGARLGGQCLPIMVWDGVLETHQKPTINADHSVLSLPATKVIAYDRNGQPLANPKLQELIQNVAAPKLSNLKIDLNKSRDDIKKVVTGYVPDENVAQTNAVVDSLKFDQVTVNEDNINLKLAFEGPAKAEALKPQPAFTAAEQEKWQKASEEWDQFFSTSIDKAVEDSKSPELGKTLRAILEDSHAAFEKGLKDPKPKGSDPVRAFFIQSWEKLTPEFRSLTKAMPELQSLRYLTFIAATDVVYEIEALGSPFGFTVSSDGLRKIGRQLIAEK